MMPTTVVSGIKLEASIARQPGIRVVSGVNSPVLAGWCVHPQSARDCCGLISFGVAGSLAPNLRPGTWIIGSEIVYGESRVATHKPWSKDIIGRMPDAVYGATASVSTPIAQPGAKAALHIETGAVAVDMVSHIVANVAVAHGLHIVAARVIIDPAERALPRAAVVSLCSNGAINIAALVGSTDTRASSRAYSERRFMRFLQGLP